MKPGVAFVSGAILGVAGAYLITESCDNLKGGAAYKKSTVVVDEPNILFKYPCKKGVKTYTIPDGFITLGNGAVSSCKNLIRINIPITVTTIGSKAFEYCTSLKSIKIMNPNINIDKDAFDDLSSLTSVTAPYKVLKNYFLNFSDASQGNINFEDLDGKKYQPNNKGVLVLVPKNK
jgi:hypothetical protein